MAGRRHHRGWNTRLWATLAAVIAAFALSQILALVHAAKYGDAPHEHFGQACVLSLAAPGGDKFVATTAFALVAALVVWGVVAPAPQIQRVRIVVASARPRGPPCR